MKKLLLIAAIASLASPAFASKARVNALGNAEFLIDPQTTFNNPSYMAWMADYVTFETGPTNPTYSPGLFPNIQPTVPTTSVGSEGGFVRSAGDAKYMAYLGRKSDLTAVSRQVTGFLGQENPIDLMYAMKGPLNWGVGVSLSNSDKKSATATVPAQKQNAYGVRLGVSNDIWEGYAVIGLGSSATGTSGLAAFGVIQDPDAKYTGTTGFKLGAAYKVENLYNYIKYYQDGYKIDSPLNPGFSGFNSTQSQFDIGVVDHNKIEAGQWFYGVAFQMYQSKVEGTQSAIINVKNTAQYVPFLLGVEYDAISWATVRASVTQNVLIGSTKADDDTGPRPDAQDTVSNNTVVAGGLGLHFNKFVVDGTLAASRTGNANTTDLLSNVALTYNF